MRALFKPIYLFLTVTSARALKDRKQVKKLIIEDINIENNISLTFLLKDKTFKKDCKKTLQFSKKADSYLKGWSIPSIIPIVNSMCINLKLPPEIKKLNSCMVISPKGTGKGDLLESILVNSNPDHFEKLDRKIFESELIKKSKDYFHNKILIHFDLIVAFEGLSTKQRQQLTNFFTMILEGDYSRETHKLSGVRTMAIFGIATEKLNKYRDQLLSETFFDRVAPFMHEVSENNKKEILRYLGALSLSKLK